MAFETTIEEYLPNENINNQLIEPQQQIQPNSFEFLYNFSQNQQPIISQYSFPTINQSLPNIQVK